MTSEKVDQTSTFRECSLPSTSASGPEPHPNFIEVSRPAPVGDRYGEVARAGEDGQEGAGVAGRPSLPMPGHGVSPGFL